MSVALARLRLSLRSLRDGEDGMTLMEVLVASLIGTIVSGAALSFMIFANEDASHITERVAVDQRARIALQHVVSELHSACVAPDVVPILEGSDASVLVFVSQAGEESAFASVEKHELLFTAPSGSSAGTLVERDYTSTGGSASDYIWASAPKTTTTVLTGIRQTSYQGSVTPVFRYYRYYREGDKAPAGGGTLKYGEIDPEAIATVSGTEAPYIVKVTVAFTATPEGTEAIGFNHDRPVPIEDSTVLRLSPSTESPTPANQPCSQAI
ncbi:MAG: PilW family protein [Solirubrobacteraceae bacterium]